jgi:hypothetical protein
MPLQTWLLHLRYGNETIRVVEGHYFCVLISRQCHVSLVSALTSQALMELYLNHDLVCATVLPACGWGGLDAMAHGPHVSCTRHSVCTHALSHPHAAPWLPIPAHAHASRASRGPRLHRCCAATPLLHRRAARPLPRWLRRHASERARRAPAPRLPAPFHGRLCDGASGGQRVVQPRGAP